MNTPPSTLENDVTREATITLPSDRETVITREFDAPAGLVFDAFTKPDLVQQWYGLRTGTMTVCEIDLRPGGHWRYVQAFPDQAFEAGFLRRLPGGRSTEPAGPHRGVEAMPGTGYVVTTTFAENDGRTTVTSHMLYQLPEHRDGHLQSGMEWGVNETYVRLDEYLAAQMI